MIVRFAMICDRCGVRQEEYAGYLSCTFCERHVCEKCCTEYDPDPPGNACCLDCADLCENCGGHGAIEVHENAYDPAALKEVCCPRCMGTGRKS